MGRSIEPPDRGPARSPARTQPKRRHPVDTQHAARGAGKRDKSESVRPEERSSHRHPNRPSRGITSGRGTRRREPTRGGRKIYNVNADERETMHDIGRFRVIAQADLHELRYHGDRTRMRQDLRSLVSQGLVQRKTVWTGRHRQKDTFFALTKAGKRFVKRHHSLPQGQAIYAGFVKSAELRHDAAIYRAFHHEAERIAKEGGRIRRVVLDYELKKKAYSPLAKASTLPRAEYAKRQAEIAREHGLKVVNGHIALPDLRIEYETRSGGSAQIDLEVASESYHGSHAAEKAAAGFRIYAAPNTARRLTAALDDHHITADILHL